jgi:acyl-CoA thioesterase
MDYPHDTFDQVLGIEFDDVRPGLVTAHLTIRPSHLNQHHTAHGGVIFTLADTVFGRASNLHGVPAVALDTSMTFVRAVREGETLVARCEEAAVRRRVAVYTVAITLAEPPELVALFRGTVYRLTPDR